MLLRKQFASAAIAATLIGGGLTAASAQSVTVTETTSGSSPLFTYSYVVTPSALTVTTDFSFQDPSAAVITATTNTGGFTALPVTPVTGSPRMFFFFGGTIAPGGSATFNFTSTDGPGGTVAVSTNGAGAAAQNGVLGPGVAAPEPGSLVSMAVLSTCLGLGIVARRRRMLAS